MSRAVVWTVEAEADLEEAQSWYEHRRAGLGERFAVAVSAVVDAIAENPRQFPLKHRSVRRAGVRRFPYGIFFVSEDDRVVVIACFHASRDPRRWQLRLSE